MKFAEKYEKTDKISQKVTLSDDFYAIGELLEKILDKLESIRLNG